MADSEWLGIRIQESWDIRGCGHGLGDEVILRGVIAIKRGISVEFTRWNAKVGTEPSVLSVTLNQVASITSLGIRNDNGQTFGIAEVYYE